MCEELQDLLDRATADGNGPLIEALETALAAAGCGGVSPQGGVGTGNGPPDPDNP